MALRRLVLILVLLATVAAVTAQLSDCELSDLFNGDTLEREMANSIRSGDNPSTPSIALLRNHTVCLSVGPTRGKYSSISLVIEYNCTDNGRCPSGGQGIEQWGFGCDNQGEWSYIQFFDFDNARTRNPTANFDTSLRNDCGACFPVHPNQENPPTIDPVTHCHECRGCSNTIGRVACYGPEIGQCCNVYVNDTCADSCPSGGGNYTIDPDTYVCTQLCNSLGTVATGGTVEYSESLVDGGYPEGSMAAVNCKEGYMGGGDITCRSGHWSGDLPECTRQICSDLGSTVSGGIVQYSQSVLQGVYPEGTTATVTCSEGYTGGGTITCENESWSGSLPGCTIQICPDLGSTVSGGTVQYSQSLLQGGYPEGTTATVTCSEGYTGGGDITCQSESWSGSLPGCTVVDCGEPPLLENGAITSTSQSGTTFGSVATYECNENYQLSDEDMNQRTCLASGSWSNEDIRCEMEHTSASTMVTTAGSTQLTSSYGNTILLVALLLLWRFS